MFASPGGFCVTPKNRGLGSQGLPFQMSVQALGFKFRVEGEGFKG